ncbi:MAG TPA: hypothetical protein VF461_24705 [Gemmatimonadaceae bacterium]
MNSHASPQGVRPAPRWSRQTLLGLALLPFVLLALLQLRSPIDLSIGDQAQYILHARSMLAGRGYTDDGYIYTNRVVISPKAYPPGLPIVIAAVEGVGAPLIVTRLLMIASAVLFLYLAGRYLATLDDPLLGPAAILMCAFIPNLPLYATGLYSDFAFAAAAWGCCLLVDRPGEWSRGRIGALTVVGAIAIAFRTAAVALIPALVVHQLWRTWRHKEPWTRAIVPLVVWVGTYLVIDALLPVTQSYAQQILTGASDAGAMSSVVALIKLVLQRVNGYRDFVSGMQLTPTPWRMVNLGYHLAALAALAIGLIVWVRRAGVRFLFCFAVFYVGIILLMPWVISRLLWPLAPLIWFATLDGARTVFQAVRIERVRAAQTAVLAGAAVAVMAMVLGPKPPSLKGIGDLPEGRALYAALEQEAASTPVRAMSASPRDAALLRGVSAMSIPPLKPDSLLVEADSFRITHAVLGSLGVDSTADRAMRDALKSHPERFHRVYGNAQFTLFRVVPAPSRQ